MRARSAARRRSDGEGDHRARARRRAIEGGDDRLVEQPHVRDDRARHPRELEVRLHIPLQQLADDLMHIAAGAEAVAAAGEDEHLHRIVVTQRFEQIAELRVDRRR